MIDCFIAIDLVWVESDTVIETPLEKEFARTGNEEIDELEGLYQRYGFTLCDSDEADSMATNKHRF